MYCKWKSSKQTQLVLQIAVKWLKNYVHLPQKLHLPNNCFVGQRAATVHTAMMLPCLLNASSSKLHFTSAALKKAPLTNQAHQQNTLKARAGTEEQGLC